MRQLLGTAGGYLVGEKLPTVPACNSWLMWSVYSASLDECLTSCRPLRLSTSYLKIVIRHESRACLMAGEFPGNWIPIRDSLTDPSLATIYAEEFLYKLNENPVVTR